MMKIWGILCFFGCISDLDARIMDVSEKFDSKEEKPLTGVVSRFDEEPANNGSLKDQKAELSSLTRENNEGSALSQEEIEKPDPYLIVNTTEKLSPPGGGVPRLDPRVVDEALPDLFPTAEAPWWEGWWNGVMEWFFGKNEAEPS